MVIIDEAQHLRPDVLEQIRLLSGVDEPKGTMLQIMLAGQQDLESLLSGRNCASFSGVCRVGFGSSASRTNCGPTSIIGRDRSRRRSPHAGCDELARHAAIGKARRAATFTSDAVQAVTLVGRPAATWSTCCAIAESRVWQTTRTIDAKRHRLAPRSTSSLTVRPSSR